MLEGCEGEDRVKDVGQGKNTRRTFVDASVLPWGQIKTRKLNQVAPESMEPREGGPPAPLIVLGT